MNQYDDGYFYYDALSFPFCVKTSSNTIFDESHVDYLSNLFYTGQNNIDGNHNIMNSYGMDFDEITTTLVLLKYNNRIFNLHHYECALNIIDELISDISVIFDLDSKFYTNFIYHNITPIELLKHSNNLRVNVLSRNIKKLLKQYNKTYNGYTKDLRQLVNTTECKLNELKQMAVV